MDRRRGVWLANIAQERLQGDVHDVTEWKARWTPCSSPWARPCSHASRALKQSRALFVRISRLDMGVKAGVWNKTGASRSAIDL